MLTHILVTLSIIAYAPLCVLGWYAGSLWRRLLAAVLGRVTGASPKNEAAQLRAPSSLVWSGRLLYPIIAPIGGVYWLWYRLAKSRRERRELLVNIVNAMLPSILRASGMVTKDVRRVSTYLGKWLVLWAVRDAEAESQDSP